MSGDELRDFNLTLEEVLGGTLEEGLEHALAAERAAWDAWVVALEECRKIKEALLKERQRVQD